MKIKLLGVIKKLGLKKEGEYRVEFRFPFSEIANIVSTINLLNSSCSLEVISDKKEKAILPVVYFYRLLVDREGESRLVLSFSFDSIDDKSLAFFGHHQAELLIIVIKYEERNGK